MNSQSLLEGLLLGVPNAQSLVEIKVGREGLRLLSFELDQQAKLNREGQKPRCCFVHLARAGDVFTADLQEAT